MLKYYIYNGRQFQFEEDKAPKGAVELKEVKPLNKSVEPENKAKTAKKKAVKK